MTDGSKPRSRAGKATPRQRHLTVAAERDSAARTRAISNTVTPPAAPENQDPELGALIFDAGTGNPGAAQALAAYTALDQLPVEPVTPVAVTPGYDGSHCTPRTHVPTFTGGCVFGHPLA